jgi:hypothetical protein
MKKPYFVSFVYWKDWEQGVACCQLNVEGHVFGWDSILAITSEIMRLNPGFSDVVVLNWRRFESPD